MPRIPSIPRIPLVPDPLRRIRLPEDLGHLGFTNIPSWADPQRALASAVITSGKPILYPELPRFYGLMQRITSEAPKVPESEMIVWDPSSEREGRSWRRRSTRRRSPTSRSRGRISPHSSSSRRRSGGRKRR